jgi:phosphatidylinositol phospholipase C beta
MFFKKWVLLSDFMAALSDPRAFISAQEKRNQQLKAMGIEEPDIKDPLVGVDGNSTAGAGGKKGSKTGGGKGATVGAKVEEEKKGTLLFISESPPFIIIHSHHLYTASSVHGTDMNCVISEDLKFESITAESLRAEKGFQKIARKQQKELDAMKKRQLKEQLTMQKQQCTAIEKLIKGKKFVNTIMTNRL